MPKKNDGHKGRYLPKYIAVEFIISMSPYMHQSLFSLTHTHTLHKMLAFCIVINTQACPHHPSFYLCLSLTLSHTKTHHYVRYNVSPLQQHHSRYVWRLSLFYYVFVSHTRERMVCIPASVGGRKVEMALLRCTKTSIAKLKTRIYIESSVSSPSSFDCNTHWNVGFTWVTTFISLLYIYCFSFSHHLCLWDVPGRPLCTLLHVTRSLGSC